MITDPVHADSLARRLAAIEERLGIIDRSTSSISVVKQGVDTGVVGAADGGAEIAAEVGYLTTQAEGGAKDEVARDGSAGLAAYRYDADERLDVLRVSDTKGLEAPQLYVDWRKTSGGYEYVDVTSASYVDVWHVDLPMLVSDTLSVGWYATVPAGTTAKWTVDLYGASYSTTERTTTGAGLEWFDVRWQHGMPATDWPSTWGIRVRIRCYRSAGAGTIEVREPTALAIGHYTGASAGGWYN